MVGLGDRAGVSSRSADDLVPAMRMSGIFESVVSGLRAEIDRVKSVLTRPIEGDWQK
ncbi:hypothetical protein ACQR1W_08605 [Bradyrhizobium sp. HKCCYLS1011]|uniref:hypothetical protein n=1 Tax=Bradyrhizobium sp. HKCCYLS1011 TaxID=3420733 RepID=UPI003EBB1BEC